MRLLIHYEIHNIEFRMLLSVEHSDSKLIWNMNTSECHWKDKHYLELLLKMYKVVSGLAMEWESNKSVLQDVEKML